MLLVQGLCLGGLLSGSLMAGRIGSTPRVLLMAMIHHSKAQKQHQHLHSLLDREASLSFLESLRDGLAQQGWYFTPPRIPLEQTRNIQHRPRA